MAVNPPRPVAPANGGAPLPASPLPHPRFLYMTWNFYAHACELLDRLVIGPNEVKLGNVLSNDRSLRMMAVRMGIDRSRYCYKQICGLHSYPGFNSAQFGDWVDVPVLLPSTQGRKRARCSGNMDVMSDRRAEEPLPPPPDRKFEIWWPESRSQPVTHRCPRQWLSYVDAS